MMSIRGGVTEAKEVLTARNWDETVPKRPKDLLAGTLNPCHRSESAQMISKPSPRVSNMSGSPSTIGRRINRGFCTRCSTQPSSRQRIPLTYFSGGIPLYPGDGIKWVVSSKRLVCTTVRVCAVYALILLSSEPSKNFFWK